MASVIGVTISLLVVFLIIVVIITISYNQHKLCFKGKPILQVFMFAIDSALESITYAKPLGIILLQFTAIGEPFLIV